MLLEALWSFFEREVFQNRFLPDTNSSLFNPYRNLIPGVDLPKADQLRRENFYSYLSSLTEWPRYLVIGEAPGWRGCRFSGIPFTSEAQLTSGRLPFTGRQSSLRSHPFSEASATIFWRVMQHFHSQILVWNCIPYHLHKPGVLLSNRSPTQAEISLYTPLLARLIPLLAFIQIITVGKCAHEALLILGMPHFAVRHPAHGGSNEFEARMARILQSPKVEVAKQV